MKSCDELRRLGLEPAQLKKLEFYILNVYTVRVQYVSKSTYQKSHT